MHKTIRGPKMFLKKLTPYYLSQLVLPGRLHSYVKMITDVQELQGKDWMRSRTLGIHLVRAARRESYGDFPLRTGWARCEAGFEPRYVYELKDAELCVPDGAIRVGGRLVAECVGDKGEAACRALAWRLGEPFLKSRMIDVSAERGCTFLEHTGYFHFLIESLARMLFVLKFRPETQVLLDEIEMHGFYGDYVEYLIRQGVIRRYQTVSHGVYRIPRFVFCAKENDSGMFSVETVKILREALLQGLPSPERISRRIFLTRKGTRRFDNQDEIERQARERGLEVIDTDGMPVLGQIALFRSAELVVSNHGAGLTNLLFANPGTRVVELFSPKWLNDCYFRLSAQLGHKYMCSIAESSKGWGVLKLPSW